jgi:proteasome lid subunit RPN8/RPN11
MKKTHQIENAFDVPQISMSRHVVCQIMCTVGVHAPETGGILLGPIGTSDITDFYFDSSAQCSSATYTPDHLTLRRKMQEQWLPSGTDFKGFCHSHPGRFDRLSEGDLHYIRRLLDNVSNHLNPATNNHFKCRHFGEVQIGNVGSAVSRRWELTDVESAQHGGTSGNPRTGAAELVISPDRR